MQRQAKGTLAGEGTGFTWEAAAHADGAGPTSGGQVNRAGASRGAGSPPGCRHRPGSFPGSAGLDGG